MKMMRRKIVDWELEFLNWCYCTMANPGDMISCGIWHPEILLSLKSNRNMEVFSLVNARAITKQELQMVTLAVYPRMTQMLGDLCSGKMLVILESGRLSSL